MVKGVFVIAAAMAKQLSLSFFFSSSFHQNDMKIGKSCQTILYFC